MTLGKSSEDYLEAVLALLEKGGGVRSVDLAEHMGYSKASISHAVRNLQDGGFLVVDEMGFLRLTDRGRAVAEKVCERRQFFTELLMAAGVDRQTAQRDAHLLEHAISDLSFEKLKAQARRTG